MADTTLSPAALLTDVQVAQIIGVQKETLEKWRGNKRHALAYIKIGHRIVRYRARDVEKFLEQRTVKPAAIAT
jgi:predicted DNA-binding transcriptional regulator AlpA